MGRWTAAALAAGLCLAIVGAGAGAQSPAVLPSPPAPGVSLPTFDHIVVLLMENKGFGGVIGNAASPYLNSLAATYAYSDAYSAVSHPSLPNYLALVGGSTFGVTSDCTSCYQAGPNITDRLDAAGISWKAYMEDLPSPCFAGAASAEYAKKHDPFVYFDGLRQNPARCAGVVPYGQLAIDLTANQLPAFGWITPNLCHDMHACPVAEGDRWLAQQLPMLISSPAFTQQRSLLLITWDEDDGGSNRVPLIAVGAGVRPGYVSHVAATHYSLLKTIEAGWSLAPLTANDAAAAPLADLFSIT